MQPDTENPPRRDPNALHARQGAAHWLATLSDESCTDAERQQFFEWLRSSTRHVDEFLRLSTLARHASRRELWPDQDIDALIAAARARSNVATLEPQAEGAGHVSRRRPVIWAIAASVACALALGAVVFSNAWTGAWFAPVYSTQIGEQRSIILEDGSIVELNTRSRLRTDFTEVLRAVELLEGEAIFRITKDPRRPFRVRTGATDIVAVGTAFNVNANDARTIVTVLEGRVRVNNRLDVPSATGPQAADEGRKFELAVGEQLIVARSRPVVRLSLQDTQKVTSWTQRRLIFEDTPVAAAAAEFARYSPHTISIQDARIGARKINGVFDATDPASLVQFLDADETVEVRREGEGWIVRSR